VWVLHVLHKGVLLLAQHVFVYSTRVALQQQTKQQCSNA
jgi:hypothetical protein